MTPPEYPPPFSDDDNPPGGARRITGPQPIMEAPSSALHKALPLILVGAATAFASSLLTKACAGCEIGTFDPPWAAKAALAKKAESDEVAAKFEENARDHRSIMKEQAETRGSITQINETLQRIDAKTDQILRKRPR